MAKNFYTLGPKATIAVAPKFKFKLLKKEVILIEDSKMLKNRIFSAMVLGGQLRKLTEVEAQELLEKGYKDVTNGRKEAEPEPSKPEKAEPEPEKTADPKKPSSEATETNNLQGWLTKASQTEIMAWMEEVEEEVVSVKVFEEASKITKVGELRKYLFDNLSKEVLESIAPAPSN